MRPNTLTQEEAAARYERMRAYQRAYYQQHPDLKERHRVYQRAYQQRPGMKERQRAYQRAYYQQHPDLKERHRVYQRARYAEMRAAWLALKGVADASA